MSIYRDGVRDGAYVIDIALTETGFDGVEDTDWENLQSYAVDHGPVQLTIDYTSTQFVFKWKAPSTSTLVFHWGDGTTSSVAGQDGTLVTTTSSYSGAGTYDFWLSGDDAALTYIDISNQAFVSGDVSGWSALTNLTDVRVKITGVTGDISGWSALTNLTYVLVSATALSGDLTSWGPALTGITYIQLNDTSFTGDLSGFAAWTSCTYIRADQNAFTFDNATAWSNTSATIWLPDNAMTSTMVNNAIEALSTCTDCTINVAGSNAHRTAASNDDLNTLLANGNTITLNDVLGAELHTNANAASITNEADATTDWVVGNNALITSVNTPVNDGSFALQIESDTTPTSGAYGAIALEGSVGTVDDTLYRISFYVRHIGSGTEWNCYISGASGGTNYRIGDTLENTDTTYVEYVYYWVQSADSDWLTFREVGNDNDGGVYVDSLSIKEVTFT